MLKALRTVIYPVDDMEKAKEWYTKLLGFGPYFDEPFYVGFNPGGYELGLDPNAKDLVRGSHTHSYWAVDGIADCLARLESMGAKLKDPMQDVGGGIIVASVLDPFGNIVGLIEEPKIPTVH